MSIESDVRDFILKDLLFEAPGSPLGEDENLFARRAIDSIGILKLVTFLEETYGITLGDDDLVPENLQDLSRIAAMVRRKRGEA